MNESIRTFLAPFSGGCRFEGTRICCCPFAVVWSEVESGFSAASEHLLLDLLLLRFGAATAVAFGSTSEGSADSPGGCGTALAIMAMMPMLGDGVKPIWPGRRGGRWFRPFGFITMVMLTPIPTGKGRRVSGTKRCGKAEK